MNVPLKTPNDIRNTAAIKNLEYVGRGEHVDSGLMTIRLIQNQPLSLSTLLITQFCIGIAAFVIYASIFAFMVFLPVSLYLFIQFYKGVEKVLRLSERSKPQGTTQ